MQLFRYRNTSWSWIAALVLAFGLKPGAALACSVCLAGDPIFDAQGVSAQQQGDFNACGWTKRSGGLPGELGHAAEEIEENEGVRFRTLLAWTPVDRLTLSLDLPFAFNEIEEDGRRISARGIGDVAVNAGVVLWRNRDILPTTAIEGRAFLKTPTGDDRVVTRGTQDKHVQPGTGSWDFGFGLAGTHKFAKAVTYTSATYRVNTEGSLDYEYGDVFLANLAVSVPAGHATGVSWLGPFTASAEINFRWADKDVFRGDRFDDSGGSILYFTPTLSIRLPWFEGRRVPSLRAGGQIPFTSGWLNGFQDEDPIWFVGLQLPIR